MLRRTQRQLLGFFSVLFVPNLASILFSLAGYDLEWLWASPSTPWGVLSANFVSPTVENFVLDFALFALFLWGFAVLDGLSSHEAEGRSGFILAGVTFASAMIAISLFVWRGGSGSGSSGVVYATAGVVLGRAVVQRGWITYLGERSSRRLTMNSYIVLAGLFLGLPIALIGGGNPTVHTVFFFVGAFSGLLLGRLTTRDERGQAGWKRVG